MSLAVAENWLVSEIQTALGSGFRSVESGPGEWSDSYLKRVVADIPAVRVAFLDGTARPTTALTMDTRWAVYVMTAWRGGAPGAMAVAEALATVLHNRLVTGAGRVRVEAFANLWTGELDRQGVALWSIGLEMPVPLDPDEAAAELDGFLRAGLDLDLSGSGGDIVASGISTLPQRQRD